jgi:hypothetical protein
LKSIKEIRKALKSLKVRSVWDKGVKEYALELLEDYEEECSYAQKNNLPLPNLNRSTLLNGAKNWKEFSYGACSLIYDCDIAKRLCNATELKMVDYGNRPPNGREIWLDVQAKALSQACELLLNFAR